MVHLVNLLKLLKIQKKIDQYNIWTWHNKEQCVTFEDGKPKGMKQVLIERGLWKNSLLADCKLCKDKVIDENR